MSFSYDFANCAQRVWRPELRTSSSIIDVVTHCRMKSVRKEPVNLKIAEISMAGSMNPFLDDFYDFSEVKKKAFSFNSSSSTIGADNSNKDCVQIHCASKSFENRMEIHRKSAKTVRIVKSKRHLARKIYLRWNGFSSSKKDALCIENLKGSEIFHSHSRGIDETHFAEARLAYLAKKYCNLWKNAIKTRENAAWSIPEKIRNGSVYNISSTSNSSRSSASQKNRTTSSRRHYEIKKLDRTIIEAQKQKIHEQDNLIKELQLLRLKLEGEKFAMETRQMLDESKRKCNQKLQSKVKQLSVWDVNDKLKVNKYKDGWDFVTRMEVRADERRKRWDAIRQRRQVLEQERLEKLRLEEEKRRQHDEEEKRRKIQHFRAEKERLADQKRRQEQERLYLNMLNSMAVEHYETLLLKSSLNSFKNHLQQEKSMSEEADRHYQRRILQRFFTLWRLFWRVEMKKKTDVAEDFYEHLLLRNGFGLFKMIRIMFIRNNQVAVDFYDLSLLKNYFGRWQLFVTRRELKMKKKEDLAAEFHEMQTLRNGFQRWKQLPRILFLEQEKEHRIRLWCNKVQELLPDFSPSYQCY